MRFATIFNITMLKSIFVDIERKKKFIFLTIKTFTFLIYRQV